MVKKIFDLKEQLLKTIDVYRKGENVMEFIKKNFSEENKNSIFSILLSYDLQSGEYNKRKNFVDKWKSYFNEWGHQLANILDQYSEPGMSFLEIGCGECTSMSSILDHMHPENKNFFGFDVSWSRIFEGKKLLSDSINNELFVADLFSIPLADNSVDIIYSVHSLEPNGGREEEAIRELIRVAKHKVILCEPIYELANKTQKIRMDKHGYVKNLKETAQKFNVNILQYNQLPFYASEENVSGILVLEKIRSEIEDKNKFDSIWQCPITQRKIIKYDDFYFNEDIGLAYPILKNIPLLHKDNMIIASKLSEMIPK